VQPTAPSLTWFSVPGFHLRFKISSFVNNKILALHVRNKEQNGLACSVAEPHHVDAAPAPGKKFDAALVPTLLFTKPTI
jgi:hypothetical protein